MELNPRTRSSNSFDEVRFVLAFIVLVAHTSALATADELQWFISFFNADFAVKGFFAISGFLVTKSYLSSGNFVYYFKKRVRRIYPAYLFAIFYCVCVGLYTSHLEIYEFLQHPELFNYIISNLFFLNFLQPSLPGSLSENEVNAINGSSWTIKVELMLYFTVPALCLFYRKIGILATAFLAFILGAGYFYFSSAKKFHLNIEAYLT